MTFLGVVGKVITRVMDAQVHTLMGKRLKKLLKLTITIKHLVILCFFIHFWLYFFLFEQTELFRYMRILTSFRSIDLDHRRRPRLLMSFNGYPLTNCLVLQRSRCKICDRLNT